MLLNTASRNYHKYVEQLFENCPKIYSKPKPLSKIDPGWGLEATWEPTLKRDASKTSFLTIWDALGPVLGRFLAGLGEPLGRQVAAKMFNKGAKRDFGVQIAVSRQ